MEERQYRPSLVGPLVLITIGALLLLNQSGRLPWSVWSTLWRFWPVVLILIGLEVLVGISRSRIVYLIGVVIAIVVLGSIIAYAAYRGAQVAGPWPASRSEQVLETSQDADRGRITLQFGVGDLAVKALVDSPNFAEGTVQYTRYSRQVEKGFQVHNAQAELSLLARTQGVPFWRPGDEVGERWDMAFTPRIPLDIKIGVGIGDIELDLRNLDVSRLEVNKAAGDTMITFPAQAGTTEASVQGAIGDITVEIPAGVGARIHVPRFLGSVKARGFTRTGDEYASADYSTTEHRLDLEIRLLIGDIIIR